MALRDISRFDGTARRIAAVSSLTGFTVAVFWLIQIVRGQVPDARTPLVEVVIVYVSILAGLFGLVATRAQVPRWSTLVLHSLSWVLPFGARGFVLKAGEYVAPHFGALGIATFVLTVVLWAAGVIVFASQRQMPAKSRAGAD
jgi:hypothetical protein